MSNLDQILRSRRSLRSLAPVTITPELISALSRAASLAPSCYNKQPWRYIFVHDPQVLDKMHDALSKGNEWAQKSSLIIAVLSHPDLDCIIKDREYFLFDTGLATAMLLLKATDLNLVAHPIAGFDPAKVRAILDIPENMTVVTLVIVGARADHIDAELSEWQRAAETERPPRLTPDRFRAENRYTFEH